MRDTLLNSIMNQISYPNPITFYFSGLIFYIFSNQQTDDVLQEQITQYDTSLCFSNNYRIFIDRFYTARPHPWGIMYTFIELLKDKESLKNKPFLKNPEFEEVIKHLFNVSHSKKNFSED